MSEEPIYPRIIALKATKPRVRSGAVILNPALVDLVGAADVEEPVGADKVGVTTEIVVVLAWVIGVAVLMMVAKLEEITPVVVAFMLNGGRGAAVGEVMSVLGATTMLPMMELTSVGIE